MVLIKEYDSIIDASKLTKIDKSNISNCCSGSLKTAGGYVWRKKEC